MQIKVYNNHFPENKRLIDKWSVFVKNHPSGNIFYTPEMYKVWLETDNYTPICYIVLDEKTEKINGVLMGALQKELSGFLGFFTSRFVIMGGPLIKDDNKDILSVLLQRHDGYIKSKAIYTQFRNLEDMSLYRNSFLEQNYKYDPHLDIHINLQQNFEDYWNTLKSKMRQKIRKADKKGLKFQKVESENDIINAYPIIQEVYKKANLPVPSKSMFTNAYRILQPKNMIAFFKASINDKIIGLRVVLLYKNMIYDWYAGSYSDYNKLNPNDFLPFKVIEWGFANKSFDIFDFGGAGKPNIPYGVRDHKLKFSNNLLELGRFEKLHHPMLFKLIKNLYQFYRTKIKNAS